LFLHPDQLLQSTYQDSFDVDWYSVDLGTGVVWLPKNRFFYDDRPDCDPESLQPDWIALRSGWLYWVPSTGEVIDNAYPRYAEDGSKCFGTVFKSLFHMVASFAVFDRYWRLLPQFWQENTENTIAFKNSDGREARKSFDSIVTPTLRDCLPVWCEINPETAADLTLFFEGLLVDLDMNPYEGAEFSDPNLPEGAVLWDPVAASLMPERRY
jgi:hypothetical protein